MSTTGATGPALTEGDVAAAPAAAPKDRQPTLTELEQQEADRQKELRARRLFGPPNKPNGAATVLPFPGATGPTGNTGPAWNTSLTGAQGCGNGPTGNTWPTGAHDDPGKVRAIGPTGTAGPIGNTGPTGTQPTANASAATNLSVDFLDDFFVADKRHLVAIKKSKGKKPDIRARHFEASDRAGQRQFITDYGAVGFDLYFSPNPIKGTLHKKANKNDVIEARHLWIDLDPRSGESLEAERARCSHYSRPTCLRRSRGRTE